MEENTKELTFKDLVDGKLHDIYVVHGSSYKVYKASLRYGKVPANVRISYNDLNPTQPCIIIDLYDKNGKNRIYTYDYYNYKSDFKSIYVNLKDENNDQTKWADGYNGKKMVYLDIDSAYRYSVRKLMEKKLEINKKIIKLQEKFKIVEKKKRFNITVGYDGKLCVR